LREIIKKENCVIIFDEFQWMANYHKELISILKMIWDQYLSLENHCSLILCGSIASFMKDMVIKSSALYGRTDFELNLQEFKLDEIKLFLPNKGYLEILEACMFVGGVPKYLDLVSNYPTVYDAMEELAFIKDSYFITEYEKIFVSHFGKNPIYQKIVELLAKHPYGLTLKSIASMLNIKPGGSFSKQLSNLESAGLLHSILPIDKDQGSKYTKYILKDPYLRFYYFFLKNKIKSNEFDKGYFQKILGSPRYVSWLGRAFEYLCMNHHQRISEIIGFSDVSYLVGPYYKSKGKDNSGTQIDLLFHRKDNVLILCEMKYLKNPVPVNTMEDVDKKIEVLKKDFPGQTILKVLITKSKPSNKIIESKYFYKILYAEDLF
ncbi:MAG: hypothetical protein HRT90_05170, partial [Candidatus Margulisbacteria bacterium]|nr:hypothetical protein [Candidatus Margulisiibacteriota bacterium]